jgi:hypothetical protein
MNTLEIVPGLMLCRSGLYSIGCPELAPSVTTWAHTACPELMADRPHHRLPTTAALVESPGGLSPPGIPRLVFADSGAVGGWAAEESGGCRLRPPV